MVIPMLMEIQQIPILEIQQIQIPLIKIMPTMTNRYRCIATLRNTATLAKHIKVYLELIIPTLMMNIQRTISK